MDIFKGFPDEESIVNYTLNQAYQDNVTVFASELLSPPHLSPPQTSSSPAQSHLSPCALPLLGPALALPPHPPLPFPTPAPSKRPHPTTRPLPAPPHFCPPLPWGPHPSPAPPFPGPSCPRPHALATPPFLGPALTSWPRPNLPAPGVIFQTRKDGSLPPHVHYKIRQNSSFTEKTNEIRRAYWRPGPNTGGRFYFLYGFVWIQGEGRARKTGRRIHGGGQVGGQEGLPST